MKRLKVHVCTGKRCRSEDTTGLLNVGAQLPADLQDEVKVKDSGCLGYCGKKKLGAPPFAEVDGEPLAGATADRLLVSIRQALKKRA